MNKHLEVEAISAKQIEAEEKPNVVGKAVYIFSMFVLLIAIFTAGVLFWWTTIPITTLVIKNNPVPVEKSQVKAGDAQILDINYCKNSSITGDVEWSLVSSTQVVLLPPYIDTVRKGCNTNLRAPVILPPIRFDNTYHFHYVVTYQVNPVKKEIVVFDSKPFTIIGLGGGGR